MSDEDVTLGELHRGLKTLQETVVQGLFQIRQDAVLRVEYEAHKVAFDREVRDAKAAAAAAQVKAEVARERADGAHLELAQVKPEVESLKTAQAQRHVPWTNVVSAIVAVVALVVAVADKLA